MSKARSSDRYFDYLVALFLSSCMGFNCTLVMTYGRLRILFAIIFVSFLAVNTIAQNCIPTNLNNLVVTRPCGQLCADLNVQIPDIRSTTDYVLTPIPYNPYPYVTPTGTQDFTLYNDDRYSALFPLPFTFCFFGDNYTSAVVGSNGLVTFDAANQSCANAYIINTPIPYSGGTPCNAGIQYVPRASILGAYSDLDPSNVPNDRKIQWEVIGTAPCRKFIVSYYHVGVYGFSCPTPANTFQIVMHESTGIIELFFERKSCASTTNAGRGILGIQDWSQTRVVTDPTKNNAFWTESNTGYRFTPSAGPSRFMSSELLTMGGATVSTATAAANNPGFLDLNFSNVCVPGGSTQYVVRTTYSVCDNPTTTLVSLDTITINLTSLDAVPSATATSCSGASNGTVTVTANNGTAPFSYSLDGGAPVNGPSPYTYLNVPAGAHTVVVTDVNGCVSDPLDVTVAAGPPLATTATKTDVLCNNIPTGTITVNQPAAGTAPYEYSLDNTNWQTNPLFTGLAANTYTVYYRDASGCQGTTTITITQPAVLSAGSSTAPVLCNGESNGTITVTANGGVAPYEYSLNGGLSWQSSNIFNVPAGPYTVTIRDVNNCITTTSGNVTEPGPLLATATTTDATCNGGNDGVITVSSTGGNATTTYSLDGVNFQPSNIFNVLPGNYTVTVKDNNNCTTTVPVTVGLVNDLVLTPQVDATICEGTSTQLELVSNGLQYSWAPATGLSNASIANPVASPTVTTQYIVTTTFGLCSAEDTVVVNVNPAPIPDAGPDGFICYGQTYQLQGSGGTQYSWTPATDLNDATIPNPVSSATRDMVYTLSIPSDANGCASLVTDEMRLDVTPPIKVNTYPFDTVAYAGDQFLLLAVPSDDDVINYTWTPSTGLSDPTIANPMVTAGAVGDVVQYQVTTSTVAGCLGIGYVTVKVYKGPDIYVPTAFTPNGDGLNDRIVPFPVGIKSMKLFRIFNRWGQLIFSTTRLHEGWDGKINGVDQPTGTYVWMIEVLTNEDKVIVKKGTVTLIR